MMFQWTRLTLFCPHPLHKPPPTNSPFLNKKCLFLIIYSFQFKFLSTFFNLMRGTLEWNEKGIKWLFDLLLRMVYVQGFGLQNGHDHEAVLINNYVRVGGGTIFYWECDNPNKTFPVICLDLWKILCFRSNLLRRKMFDYILLRC